MQVQSTSFVSLRGANSSESFAVSMAADESTPVPNSKLYSDEDWYHGEQTTEKAELALKASARSCFLVRQHQGDLILSLRHYGLISHMKIECGPEGYELEGQSFSELQELVSFYRRNDISDKFAASLGEPCKKMGTASFRPDLSPDHGMYDKTESPLWVSVIIGALPDCRD